MSGHVKLRTAEAQRIADLLQRLVPYPNEHAEVARLIKLLRGGA